GGERAGAAGETRRGSAAQRGARAAPTRRVGAPGGGVEAKQPERVRRAQPEESVVVSMGGRMPRPVARGDITGAPAPMPPPPMPGPANQFAPRRAEAPPLSAPQGAGNGIGQGMGPPPAGPSRGAGARRWA